MRGLLMRATHEFEQEIVWYTERVCRRPKRSVRRACGASCSRSLRASAATAFWSDEQAALEQAEAVALIARQIKFRPKSVLSLPVEKKATHLAGLVQVSDLLAARLVIAYHLEHQRPMMGAFLDALGIAHEDGLIKDDSPTAPDAATLDKGVKELAGEVSEAGCGALLLGVALAGPRNVGWTQRPPRTGPGVGPPITQSESSDLRGSLRQAHLHLLQPARAGASPRQLRSHRRRSAAESVQEGARRTRPQPRIRANKSGCLDQCEKGPTVVVYPDTVWYGRVTEADVDEIVEQHIIGGRPVERLLMPE